MDDKYVKIIEDLVADLLNTYTTAIIKAKDEHEYCTVVTASLVFKELALIDFKKAILRDSDDNPDDICESIDKKAKEIALSIRARSLQTQQSLN